MLIEVISSVLFDPAVKSSLIWNTPSEKSKLSDRSPSSTWYTPFPRYPHGVLARLWSLLPLPDRFLSCDRLWLPELFLDLGIPRLSKQVAATWPVHGLPSSLQVEQTPK